MKTFLSFLKTLFSNNECVTCARTNDKSHNIVAVFFALFAVFFAVLPMTVQSFRKNGSDWVNSSVVYDLDRGLLNFTNDSIDSEIVMTIKPSADGKTSELSRDKDTWYNANPEDAPVDKQNLHGLHRYKYSNTIKGETKLALEVYIETEMEDKDFAEFCSNILNNLNPYDKKDGKSDEDSFMYWTLKDDNVTKVKTPRSTSTIFFGKHYVYGYMYSPASTNAVSNFGGDYNTIDTNDFLKDYIKGSIQEKTDIDNYFKSWKTFFDKAFLNNRWNSAWTTTGIMVGVDCGVILLMGLLVFILTRGKNNPFRIYTWWDGQKIAYYASLCPGLLSLAFGFLISNLAMMLFVMTVGIRVMWLSMKTLRPAQ